MTDIRGQGVVVTGAGRGIGAAIAARMAAGGARVVVNDLDAVECAAVAEAIGGYAVPGDAATGAEELIARATEQLGRIDIFFANAGIEAGTGLDTPESVWDKALQINVLAHVRAARVLVPTWLETGGGRFVVTASAAGLLTMLGSATYAVSKHAAVAFAEWLSITYGNRGIVVQALCPQGVNTRMLAAAGPLREVLSHDPALEPDEVAEEVWQALGDDRFLILPHAMVRDYYVHKASDTERWLGAMRKLQARLDALEGGT